MSSAGNKPMDADQRRKALALLKKRKQSSAGSEKPAKATIPTATSADGHYPVSASQRRLWFLTKMDGGSAAYHIPFSLKIIGQFDLDNLAKAAAHVVQQNSALRTSFVEQGTRPMQKVLPQVDVNLQHSYLEQDIELPMQVQQQLAQWSAQPFDLTQAPLARFSVLHLPNQTYYLHINVHHIVADGISVSILFEQLLAAYSALSAGKALPVAPTSTPDYKDFVVWQQQQFAGDKEAQLSKFWQDNLAGSPKLIELPTDNARPPVISDEGRNIRFHISEKLSEQIRSYGSAQGITPYIIMLSVYYALMARYSRQNDIVIGTPVGNRDYPGSENIIGYFANTLALRIQSDSTVSFNDLVKQVKTVLFDAHANQQLPFERIVELLNPERSTSFTPIFQVSFSFQRKIDQEVELPGLKLVRSDTPNYSSKFDIGLEVHELSGIFHCELEYKTDLYQHDTMSRFIGHYQILLERLLNEPDQPIYRGTLMNAEEQSEFLEKLTGPEADFPLETCFPDGFDAQVARTPDAIAAEMDDQQLTYRQLQHKTNQLAQLLIDMGISHDDLVGLYVPRTIDYLIAMIAVWKSGGAFVPLSKQMPQARVETILRQCQPKVVLTAAEYDDLTLADDLDFPIINMAKAEQQSYQQPFINRAIPRSLAYAIYTSGSTGTPKGAMIEHEGMTNHLWLKITDMGMTAEDIVGEIAVTTFDVSIWQYVSALLIGAKTVVFKGDDAWVPKQLLEVIQNKKVSVLQTVPSHTKIILDEMETNSYDLSCLRIYMCNGEALPKAMCIRFYQSFKHSLLVNAYGATETSDDSCHLHVHDPQMYNMPYMPISGILPSFSTYILDEYLNPVPAGVIGEVFIGGLGVGRGYFNEQGKTALNYIPDPFSKVPGSRLYRIGDLARYNTNGTIEFIGRVDFQVKIRGLRVELSEIEKVLVSHQDIKECVVTAVKTDGEFKLIGYVVSESGINDEELLAYCSGVLPDYMVPSHIEVMDKFPLSINGKVDRKALPVPSADSLGKTPYVAASTLTEKTLCQLYSQVLNREQVGVNDDFFRTGGHSLLVIDLVNQINKALDINLGIRNVFENPIVRNLAGLIDREYQHQDDTESAVTALVKQPRTQQSAPLAPSQIAVWYTYLMDKTSPVYNVNFAELFFTNLNVDNMIAAWQTMIDRHDIFRMQFVLEQGNPIQKLGPKITLKREEVIIDRQHLTGDDMMQQANRLAVELGNAPFDLENGPLIRLNLVAYGSGEYQLIFTTHHIVWDETSTINLISELATIYNALNQRQQPQLPALPVDYLDYAEWINQRVSAGDFEKDRQYWLKQYADVPKALELPTDMPRPAIQTFNGDTALSWIRADQVNQIRQFIDKQGTTLFMYMLAVLELYLARISNQNEFVIGCPIANRHADEVKDMFGLFAAPLPIKTNVSMDLTVNNFIDEVKERCIEAYEHQDYPCNQLIESLTHQRDLSRPKLFSVMYGLQNNKNEVLSRFSFGDAQVDFKKLFSTEDNSARFDLTFVVDEIGEEISYKCIYNSDLFYKSSVENMLEDLVSLALQLPSMLDTPLKQVDIVHLAAQQMQQKALQGKQIAQPSDNYIELFEQQVSNNKEAIAILSDDKATSYGQLSALSNQYARYFDQHHQGMKRAVLMVPSSAELLALAIACGKQNICYIPIGIDTPVERVQLIIEASKPELVIIADEIQLNSDGTQQLTLSELNQQANQLSDQAVTIKCQGQSHAYIIFTSGTTGKPKGIPIEHHSVVNMLISHQSDYQLTSDDRILFQTPFSFDASLLETFWPLCFGGSLAIMQKHSAKNLEQLHLYLENANVTIFQSVPMLLEAYLDYLDQQSLAMRKQLRLVIVGGSVLNETLAKRCQQQLNGILANHYGPTEVTVDATTHCYQGSRALTAVPIGRPVANAEALIVDQYGNRQPSNVPGELLIASPGLSPGYLDDAEKTAAAFVMRQQPDGSTKRYYRTGDVCSLLPDGEIYFMGRIDKQVKVAGNRIELEEIEMSLSVMPEISSAVVKASADGHGLTAHVELLRSGSSIQVGDLNCRLYTLAQRPDLRAQVDRLHLQSWPSYSQGSHTVRDHWSMLYNRYPEYQLLIEYDNQLVAVGNTLPAQWDGSEQNLCEGWDDIVMGKMLPEQGKGNTLAVLAGVVDPQFRGKGASGILLQVFKQFAGQLNYEQVLIPVRPSEKVNHTEMSFEQWCQHTREDGLPADAWIRTHVHVGGELMSVAAKSQLIEGTIAQWSTWCNSTIERSGRYYLPNLLSEAEVDLDADKVTYWEPALWVSHTVTPAEPNSCLTLTRQTLLEQLGQSLPTYMLPNHVLFHGELPKTESGKLDEKALSDIVLPSQAQHSEPLQSETQHQVAAIWQAVLGEIEIGANSDFFHLGGQSLKVVSALAKLNEQFNVKLEVSDFYIHSTVQAISSHIDEKRKAQ